MPAKKKISNVFQIQFNCMHLPRGDRFSIMFMNVWLICITNVGKYTIHDGLSGTDLGMYTTYILFEMS